MSDYLEKLNPKQYEAVVNQGHPLLILAGAGSGKTRVITSKIAYLVEHCGTLPSSILAVTFTNKAAGEMRDRVANFLGYTGDMKSYELPMIRTFHSFGAWILRRNSEYAGLSPNFSIYDDSDMVSLLKSLEKSGSKRDIKLYANLISRAKDFGLSPYDDLTEVTFDPDFPAVYKAYQEKLDSIGNVDFGDLILKAVELLKNNREIRDRLSRKFQVILVDEYQDSNIAQFELLKLLAGDGRSLTVVGDDDQSIYKFRGAEVQNIIGFPEYFSGTKVIKLEQNYRSTAPILNLASAVVDKNKGRLGKKLWTARKGGRKPVLTYFNTAQEEAEYCASLVAKDKVETAILYRTNAQSRLFENVFTRLNIPYRIVGSLRFYEREEVKDTLAWMAFLVNPKDQVSFQRIINKPARGIGKATVDKILASEGEDIATRLKTYVAGSRGKSKEALEEFLEIYSGLSTQLAQPGENLSSLINEILRSSGLYDYYKAEDKEERTYKVDNLIELSNAASEFPAGAEGITQFLENVELDSGASQTDENARVTLITMHNTKGLEFDRVIITGLEDQLFPGRGAEEEGEIEEERRIFYVSITRARNELYMTSCRQRMIWGKSQFCSPSRFLDEIPAGYLDINGGGHTRGRAGTGYKIGDYIYRDDYGVGVVVKSWVEAGEPVVVVRFETGQYARFLTNYTKLEKISP
jgi:DNA helicase-2/ATP-dependent DNA helicase PcrA